MTPNDRISPTGRASVYVHVPFCLRHCPYCDFAVTVFRHIPHAAYADAVLSELSMRWDRELSTSDVGTLYFGGGTPGLWQPDALLRVVEAVRSRSTAELGEVTVELNPERLDRGWLEALRSGGVTRASLGVQSFDDEALRTLGRMHDGAMARAAVDLVVEAGFPHVSVDLIWGVPGRDRRSLAADLATVGDLAGVDHVSAYELTWEPGTGFEARRRRGVLAALDEDALADAADQVAEALGAAGFERYEVSNWSRPGGRSRHNGAYWEGDEYLGVGVGAHSLSLVGGLPVRRANACAFKRWMADPEGSREAERLSADLHVRELWMVGMRRAVGVDRTALALRTGGEPAWVDALVSGWVSRGLAERVDGRVRPTSRGLWMADAFGAEALDAGGGG